ncbi:MAG: ATP-binding cassette domain-containing protein [Pasteurellaceae bacterium]|nr:ATP-binding cassette domain-containing protein [Pasteurellaceae bacterium]
MPTLLSVHQLGCDIAQKRVLDSLSFSVKQGEIVALVGASGSGKSTLMKAIMGSVPISQGEIQLNGKPIQDYRNPKMYAQQVGMLHQQYDLVKPLSVVHNVLAGRLNQWGFWRSLWSLVMPQERHLAEQALTAVGLADKLYQATATLSGGEQQRVAIARLLVQNPQLILADEPISALDPVNAQHILALLTGLVRQQGKTLIASLHAIDYAQHYFDRMIGIQHGKMLFDLPTHAVTPEHLEQLYGVAK